MELGSLNFQAKLAKLFGTCVQKNAKKRMLPCFPLYSEVPQFRFLPSVRDLGFKSYTQKDLRTDFSSSIGARWLLPCFVLFLKSGFSKLLVLSISAWFVQLTCTGWGSRTGTRVGTNRVFCYGLHILTTCVFKTYSYFKDWLISFLGQTNK